MVTSGRVGEDLYTVQAHVDMRTDRQYYQYQPTHLAGVNSSSHSSTPITVSSVATTASPKGTVFYHQRALLGYIIDLPDQ